MNQQNKEDIEAIEESIYFLKMDELEQVCTHYSLPPQGKKAERITRILTFLKTGRVLRTETIPLASRKKPGLEYPLAEDTKMVWGHYRNDKKNRQYFKELIGQHFHFTGFGIDWLHQRWMASNPPTYREFSQYWQDELKRRSHHHVKPKEEFAYLNFVQNILKEKPNLKRTEIIKLWKAEQKRHTIKVFKLLGINL